MTREELLVATDVSKSFGSTRALRGIDIKMKRGITGLLGPNGAGKTTLLRILATVIRPDSGTVKYFGPGQVELELQEIRRRLGYMPQEPTFYERFSVREFLGYIGILKEVPGKRQLDEEVDRVLHLAELEEVAGRRLRVLSGGMRQRVSLAQALIGSPALLLLDEPTAGLDPAQRFRLRGVLARFAEDSCVLLSTHQTEDVAALCDRVVLLNRGRVRFAGTIDGFRSVARDRVWIGREHCASAVGSWRGPDGLLRNIGTPPRGTVSAEPLVEDAYLLLVSEHEDA